ncbi:MAG TPA: DUF3995 domain-containing protein [Nannocystis sp.]
MLTVSSLAAAVVAACLIVLAFIHVYWGAGGAWPARTRAGLGPMVVGTPPGTAMPNLPACLLVAALLVTAAGLVASAGLADEPPWFARLGSAGVAGVLALRGLGGFIDGRLRPDTRTQPYYALNRRIYSPLCLALAALIAVVLACRA